MTTALGLVGAVPEKGPISKLAPIAVDPRNNCAVARSLVPASCIVPLVLIAIRLGVLVGVNVAATAVVWNVLELVVVVEDVNVNAL